MFYNDKYPIEYTIGIRELIALGCVVANKTTMFGVEYVEIRFPRGISKVFKVKGYSITHRQPDSIDKMIFLIDFINKK